MGNQEQLILLFLFFGYVIIDQIKEPLLDAQGAIQGTTIQPVYRSF